MLDGESTAAVWPMLVGPHPSSEFVLVADGLDESVVVDVITDAIRFGWAVSLQRDRASGAIVKVLFVPTVIATDILGYMKEKYYIGDEHIELPKR